MVGPGYSRRLAMVPAASTDAATTDAVAADAAVTEAPGGDPVPSMDQNGSMRTALLVGLLGLIAVLGLAFALDGYTQHGWNATYRRTEGDNHNILIVARHIEPVADFETPHRPFARYVQGWDYPRWGVPTELPVLDVVLSADVMVPPGPPRWIVATSPNTVEARVDGRPVQQAPVAAGVHPVEIYWSGPTHLPNEPNWDRMRPTSMRFSWGSDRGALRPVPLEALTPATGSWTPRRVLLWIAGPLLAVMVGCWLLLAFRVSGPRRARRLFALATVLIAILGASYRIVDYDVMPEFRENPDELFASWNGFQLLTDGTTRGWSLWAETYGDRVELEHFPYFRTRPFRVIRPYFEHPPLLHLLAGAAAKIAGTQKWQHVKLKHVRAVPIALYTFSIFLIIAVGRRIYPKGLAPHLGALLYAILPFIVLQNRVVKEEALLTPLCLGGLLFYLRYVQDGERRRDLIGAAILMGLCPLAKVPGLVFVPILAMMLTATGRYRAAVLASAIGLGVASLLLVYGAALNWDVFWFTTQHQASGRPSHYNIFARFFDDPLVNHNLIGRGWLIFLWIGWAASAWAVRAGKATRRGAATAMVLTVPLLLYLVAIGVSSGNWTFGWYMAPVQPLLCIGAGAFLAAMWERPTVGRAFFFVTLLLMYSMNFTIDPLWAKQSANWEGLRHDVTYFCAAWLLPFALAHAFRLEVFRKLAQATMILGLATMVVLSGIFVTHYDVYFERYKNFDRDVYFDR